MTPAFSLRTSASGLTMPARRLSPTRRTKPRLQFREMTLADIPEVSRLLAMGRSRTCDFTIGGIYMWIDFFKYRFCIVDDTLFMNGVTENHTDLPAFSLPVGKLPLADSLKLLEDYCAFNEIPLRFSAVPSDRLAEFTALRRWDIEPLDDWSDYLYDIETLSTLSGKKMAKKRNHVNRFMADNPGAYLSPLTAADVDSLVEAYDGWLDADDDANTSETALQERQTTVDVLRHLAEYPFEGAVLRLADGTPVAFTLGEIIGDTVFVHIEKMNHEVSGAGETINKMFASMIRDFHPQVLFANREEDCGDPGLRYAKESYHPYAKLTKFNLRAL